MLLEVRNIIIKKLNLLHNNKITFVFYHYRQCNVVCCKTRNYITFLKKSLFSVIKQKGVNVSRIISTGAIFLNVYTERNV